MSRLLVAADLHLGAGAAYGRHPGSRLLDQADAWMAACRVAVEREVNGVLFAGDLFDRPRPTPGEYLAAIRGLKILRAQNIPVVLLAGNHDQAGTDASCALDVLSMYATVAKTPRLVDVAGVPVACLPWTSPARFAAESGGDRDEAHRSIAERLVETAAGLRAEGGAVLLLHWSLSGAVSASGQSADSFREVVLPTRDLEAQGWDWIIAGHLHARQSVGMFGFYPGSLCVCDFSEANQPHGVALIDDCLDLDLHPEWVEVEQRPFGTLDITLGLDDLVAADSPLASNGSDQFDKLLLAGDFTDAVVRVRYSATEEQARRVDHHAIQDALYAAGAHKVYAIEPTIQRATRARVETASVALSPTDALDVWIEHQDVEKERAIAMRQTASEYEETLR